MKAFKIINNETKTKDYAKDFPKCVFFSKSRICGQIHAPFIQLYSVIPSQAGLNESGPERKARLETLKPKILWRDTTMMKFVKNFRNDESGAVTVDWVVLTAAVVGLAVAAYSSIEGGASELTADTDTFLGKQDPNL